MTRDPVAEIVEVLPPAAATPMSVATSSTPTAAATSSTPNAVATSTTADAVAKNQSTTRQALMEEINYTTHLMVTSGDRDKTYASHLRNLKEKLRSLTSGNQQETTTSGILEIDQVLGPAGKTESEPIAEMEEIMPPTTIRSHSMSPRKSNRGPETKSLRTSRSRSMERSGHNRASTRTGQAAAANTTDNVSPPASEARDAAIPTVISFDRSPVYNDGAGVDEEAANSLVEQPQARHEPKQTSHPTVVRVVAPANLPPGYQLDVQLDDHTFTVAVPPGGVSKGQAFEAEAMNGLAYKSQMKDPATENSWKGGLFDCLAYGVGHPMFCNSFFCPQSTYLTS